MIAVGDLHKSADHKLFGFSLHPTPLRIDKYNLGWMSPPTRRVYVYIKKYVNICICKETCAGTILIVRRDIFI